MTNNKIYQSGDTLVIETSNVTLDAVWIPVYTITYNANGSDSGSAPSDNLQYTNGSIITVLSNTSGLNKNFGFRCWNTKADGSGTYYVPGDTFRMGNENVILYALYYDTDPIYIGKGYNAVTYNGNGNTSGFAPVDNTHYPLVPIFLIGGKGNFTVQGNIGGLVKEGYAFNGWNTNPDGSGKSYKLGDAFYLLSDLTFYAVWVPVYTVTYDVNGGEYSPVQPKQYPAGTKVKAIDANRIRFVRADYSFLGWNTDPYGHGTTYSPDDVFTLNSDTTLYAIWRNIRDSNRNFLRVLSFKGCDNTDGTLPPMRQFIANQPIALTVPGQGTLKKDGYTFDGWYYYDTCYHEGEVITDYEPGGSLYANWVPTITVTYNGNEATSGTVPIDNNTYVSGVPMTLKGNTGNLYSESKGFFLGWSTDANGSGNIYKPGDIITMSDSITLYAAYTTVVDAGSPPPLIIDAVNVIYFGNHADGGRVPTDINQYAPGATVSVLDNTGGLYRNGYYFIGWNTMPNGSGTSFKAGITFNFPQTDRLVALFAMWEAMPIESVRLLPTRIDYSPNGAQGGWIPNSYGCYYGQTIRVEGNIGNLYIKDHTFGGWSASFNSVTYQPNDTFSFPFKEEEGGVVTLYAVWEPYPTYYKAKYKVQNNVYEDSIDYETGDKAIILSNNTPITGKYFCGWSNGDGKFYQPSDTVSMVPNMIFDAIYDTEPHYFVTYDGNGNASGLPPDDYNKYKKGYYANSYVNIAYEGSMSGDSSHFFYAWNTKADGSGTTYNPGDSFLIGTSNVTLYAMWKLYPNYRSVIYNGNGSTGGAVPIDSTDYSTGNTVSLAENTGGLSNNFCVFYGWWVNGNIYKPGNTFTLTGDTTVYAVWGSETLDESQFSVSYNGNGSAVGFVPTRESAYNDYGYSITLPDNTGGFAIAGYVFDGWSDNIRTYQPGESYYTTSTVNKTTFYAVWAPLYSVIYDGNGNTAGTVPTTPNGYKPGATVTVPDNNNNLTKTGYIFNGWWINGSLYQPGSAFAVTSDKTKAAAVWTADTALTVTLRYSIIITVL